MNLESFERNRNDISIENESLEDLRVEYDKLRKNFLESSRNQIPGTEITRDRETILSEQIQAQRQILEFGIKHKDFYNNEAFGPSRESFRSALLASANYFTTRIQKTGDYYIPEKGQSVLLVDDEDGEGLYDFTITKATYNPELKSNKIEFRIRDLRDDKSDVVHLGIIEFDDDDFWPEIIMSPYSIDVVEPDNLQRRNGDKSCLLMLKALRATTDLISVPIITRNAFTGKRLNQHESRNLEATQLVSERSFSPMTRRATINALSSDTEIAIKLNSLHQRLTTEDIEAINNKYPDIRYKFFLKSRSIKSSPNFGDNNNERQFVIYTCDVDTIPVQDKTVAIDQIRNILKGNPGDSVVVVIEGSYIPPEWEDPDHQKKHTEPYVRRMRRKTGNIGAITVIDDRSSEEWLIIKRKLRSSEELTLKEQAMLDSLYKKRGIHLSDGTFSQSKSAEGKQYFSVL